MEKFMKKMWKKSEGFTLVELIVVIAILGILAAVAVPAYSGYITKANEAGDFTALDAVKTAAMATYAEDGSVTKIVVTDKDNATPNTVTVYLDNSATAESATHSNTDFKTYSGIEAGSSFTIDLKTGKTATWDNSTGAANKGEWVITQ